MIYEHAAYENGGSLPSDLAIRLAPLLFGTPPSRLRRFVGASHAGALVGYSTVTAELSTWQASEFLNMDCLFIRDHARGHGLGKLSMAVIKGEAAPRGFTATDDNQRVNHRDVAGPVGGSPIGTTVAVHAWERRSGPGRRDRGAAAQRYLKVQIVSGLELPAG